MSLETIIIATLLDVVLWCVRVRVCACVCVCVRVCVYLGGGGALFVFYFLAYFSSFALSVSVVKGLGGWHCTHYVWVNSRFRVEKHRFD